MPALARGSSSFSDGRLCRGIVRRTIVMVCTSATGLERAAAGVPLRAGLPIKGDGSPASLSLGLNIHNRNPSDQNLQLMGDAGLHWLRADGVTWKEMEPEPGKYNFSQYTYSIQRLVSHGHRVMTGVDGVTPPWLSPDMRNASTQHAYARLMAALALEFEDQQVLWELSNEPNMNVDWSGGNATAFGIFMHSVCSAMHKSAPRSLCVGPSNAFISRGFMTWNWLQEFFETGVLRELDAVLVHPYRCDAPETALKDFDILRTLLAEYSPVNRSIPIYSGEWGYADTTGATPLVTVEMQAKLVSRLSLVSMMATDGVSIYYEWQDNGLPEFMGLTYENGTVKPSYLATKTLAHVLANASFIARRPTWQDGFTTDDEFVLQFRTQEGTTVLAVWTLAGFPHVTRLPAVFGCWSVVDHLGTPGSQLCGDHPQSDRLGGGLHVNLTDAPQFLTQQGTV